jgi:3-deoxy-7-phosphoheptulonate synthase
MVEVHSRPQEALCDADQALTPEQFGRIMSKIRPLKRFFAEAQETTLSD